MAQVSREHDDSMMTLGVAGAGTLATKCGSTRVRSHIQALNVMTRAEMESSRVRQCMEASVLVISVQQISIPE